MPFIDLNENCLYAHKPVKEEIRRNLENTLSNNFTRIDISVNVAETPQNYLGKFKPINQKTEVGICNNRDVLSNRFRHSDIHTYFFESPGQASDVYEELKSEFGHDQRVNFRTLDNTDDAELLYIIYITEEIESV